MQQLLHFLRPTFYASRCAFALLAVFFAFFAAFFAFMGICPARRAPRKAAIIRRFASSDSNLSSSLDMPEHLAEHAQEIT
jgi:hypothetical protein